MTISWESVYLTLTRPGAAARLVRRRCPLGDDALEALRPRRRLHHLGVVAHRREGQRWVRSHRRLQQRPTLAPRSVAQVVAVEGEKVEHDEGVVAIGTPNALERMPALLVVGDHLAVEDDVVIGGRSDSRGQPPPLGELRLARRADCVEVVAGAPTSTR